MWWPPGYSATLDPVVLYGPDGDVVAREGDRIVASGADGAYGLMDRCRLGRGTVGKIDADTPPTVAPVTGSSD